MEPIDNIIKGGVTLTESIIQEPQSKQQRELILNLKNPEKTNREIVFNHLPESLALDKNIEFQAFLKKRNNFFQEKILELELNNASSSQLFLLENIEQINYANELNELFYSEQSSTEFAKGMEMFSSNYKDSLNSKRLILRRDAAEKRKQSKGGSNIDELSNNRDSLGELKYESITQAYIELTKVFQIDIDVIRETDKLTAIQHFGKFINILRHVKIKRTGGSYKPVIISDFFQLFFSLFIYDQSTHYQDIPAVADKTVFRIKDKTVFRIKENRNELLLTINFEDKLSRQTKLKFCLPDFAGLLSDVECVNTHEIAAYIVQVPGLLSKTFFGKKDIKYIISPHSIVNKTELLKNNSEFEGFYLNLLQSYILYEIILKNKDIITPEISELEPMRSFDPLKQFLDLNKNPEQLLGTVLLPFHMFDFFNYDSNNVMSILRDDAIPSNLQGIYEDIYTNYSIYFCNSRPTKYPVSNLCNNEQPSNNQRIFDSLMTTYRRDPGSEDFNTDDGTIIYEYNNDPFRSIPYFFKTTTALYASNDRSLNPSQVRCHTLNSICNRIFQLYNPKINLEHDINEETSNAIYARMMSTLLWPAKKLANSILGYKFIMETKTIPPSLCPEYLVDFYDKLTEKKDSYNNYQLTNLPYHPNKKPNTIGILYDGPSNYTGTPYFDKTKIHDFNFCRYDDDSEKKPPDVEYIRTAALLNILTYQNTNAVNTYIRNTIKDTENKTSLNEELTNRNIHPSKIRHLFALYPDIDHGVYDNDTSPKDTYTDIDPPREIGDRNPRDILRKDNIVNNKPYYDYYNFKCISKKPENRECEGKSNIKLIPMQHQVHVYGIFSEIPTQDTVITITELYVIFRGSATLHDWEDTDKAISLGHGHQNVRVHSAKILFRLISKKLEHYIDDKTKLIISGHSLGGFLAAYATLGLKNDINIGLYSTFSTSNSFAQLASENIIPILFDPFFAEDANTITNGGHVLSQLLTITAIRSNENDYDTDIRVVDIAESSTIIIDDIYIKHLNLLTNGWIVRLTIDLASYALYSTYLKNKINRGLKLLNINSSVEPKRTSEIGMDVWRNGHAMSHFTGVKAYSEIYSYQTVSDIAHINAQISPYDCKPEDVVNPLKPLEKLNPLLTVDSKSIVRFMKQFITTNHYLFGKNRIISTFCQNYNIVDKNAITNPEYKLRTIDEIAEPAVEDAEQAIEDDREMLTHIFGGYSKSRTKKYIKRRLISKKVYRKGKMNTRKRKYHRYSYKK
jgi:hypothetical protein